MKKRSSNYFGGTDVELTKLRGRTYYIPGSTNVGVYRYRNGFCTLVDSGIDNTKGKRILDIIELNKLKVKYLINTHAHPDHFNANNYIKENHPGTLIASSSWEKLFMENSSLEGMMLYGATPMPGFTVRFLKGRDTVVDIELPEGPVELGNRKFDILSLKGHSPGQIGVATEDNVLFCGDAFFSEETMKKYPLPFLFDIGEQLKTLNFLLETNYDYYIISHSDGVLEKPKDVIRKNIANIHYNLEIIKDFLAQPLTREDLAALLINKYKISMNLSQYFITFSTVSAFLTYLLETQNIDMDIIDGKMYFYV